MTDLRALLLEAAPRPSYRVDVHRLVAEAERRRRGRRLATWLGSIVLALGVGGGAVGVLTPADQPAQVETLPGPTRVEDVRGPDLTVGPAAVESHDSDPGRAAVASHSTRQQQDDASLPFAASGQPWEGCVAEGHRDGARLGYNGGLYSSETPSCRYEATRPGGYEGSGVWTLEIRRGTEDIVYRGGESPDCMPVGTIQPGDVVTVTTSAGSEAAVTGSPFIRAGPDYGCR